MNGTPLDDAFFYPQEERAPKTEPAPPPEPERAQSSKEGKNRR